MPKTPFNPEPISEALLAHIKAGLLSASLGFRERNISRRPRVGQNVTSGDRPACYVLQQNIRTSQSNKGLPIYEVHFTADVAMWDKQNDSELPETVLNSIFFLFTQSLFGSPLGEAQTLGGLVENVWIEGDSPIVQATVPDQELWRFIPLIARTGI